MKLLLTSSGLSNESIRDALVELMGKSICEANALLVPTGVYPFRYGQRYAWNPIGGQAASRISQLGWKSMGILELSVLPSIHKDLWLTALQEADVLLVWGGDPLFITYWMQESGVADILPTLPGLVYAGVSAGSIAVASLFAETYSDARACAGTALKSEEIIFDTPKGKTVQMPVTARGMGFTDFAIIPHFQNHEHFAASLSNAAKWASHLPVPVYAIDDETAIKVRDGEVEIISEGEWKLFEPESK